LLDAAEALFEVGSFPMADACLETAIQGAASMNDSALETTARLVRMQFHFMAEGEGDEGLLLDEAEKGIRLLEGENDHGGLARAMRLLYFVHGTKCRYAAAADAVEQIMKHARAASDHVMEKRFLTGLVICALYGPTPVPELIARCNEILEKAGDDRKTRAMTASALAHAEAMSGDFSRVRELYTGSRAILEDLGWNLHAALISLNSGPIEMAAGDLEAAERELRRDYEALDAMGERNYISTTAGWLAEVLYRLGNYDEALKFTEMSEKIAAPDDVTSQFLWRCVRAKLFARADRFEEAEMLALDSVSIIGRSDDTDSQAQALMDLAEVLTLAAKPHEALPAVEQALLLFDQKGNVVAAAEAKAALERILSGGPDAPRLGRDLSIVIDLDPVADPITS
jgi:tetratricopeptide (TPR) repeat protein